MHFFVEKFFSAFPVAPWGGGGADKKMLFPSRHLAQPPLRMAAQGGANYKKAAPFF